MEKRTNDDIESIADLPVSTRVRMHRSRKHLKKGLPFSELERIGAQRIWGVVAELPAVGDDDFEPKLPNPDEDRYLV